MSKETIIVILLVIVAFLGGSYFSKGSNSSGTATNPSTVPEAGQPTLAKIDLGQVRSLFNDKNLVFGNKDSKLLFVEFSDPSCPYCHVAAGKNPDANKQIGTQFLMASQGGSYVAPEPEMKKLVDQGKAAFVWMYAYGHGNGEMATQALYCANEKGKFWQVHDLLMSAKGYELQNTTIQGDKSKSGVMADFLKNVVNANEMKACIDSGKYADRLVSDMETAKKFNFNGTPYFIVNTTDFIGAYSFTDMQSAVDAALK